MSDDMTSMNIRIEGEVQGIGYRDFVIREATQRGLRGWVRNRSDGTVEALAHGATKAVEDLITACMAGPKGCRVTAFNLSPGEPPEQLGFVRRPSV